MVRNTTLKKRHITESLKKASVFAGHKLAPQHCQEHSQADTPSKVNSQWKTSCVVHLATKSSKESLDKTHSKAVILKVRVTQTDPCSQFFLSISSNFCEGGAEIVVQYLHKDTGLGLQRVIWGFCSFVFRLYRSTQTPLCTAKYQRFK